MLIGILIAAMSFFAIASTQMGVVHAQGNKGAVCEGVKATGGTCDGAAQGQLETIIKAVVNVLSIVVGAAAVIMLIISGLRFITSSGDSSGIQAARNGIIYAIVGLVIVIFAQVIVNFVVYRSTTVTVPAPPPPPPPS